MTDKEKIEYLSKDEMFGILTRPALELKMSESPPGSAMIFFIDIDGLHRLNKQRGYLAVNLSIRNVFRNIFRKYPNLIVGRVFSGDEIVIVDPDKRPNLISDVKQEFKSQGMDFEFISYKTDLGLSLSDHAGLLNVNVNALHVNKRI